MARLLSLGRFALVALLTALAALAALVALPHDSWIRYQSFDGTIFERLRWIHERIHFDPVPIDILVLGSSREGAGVVGPELEAALAARGLSLQVANFSIPASGMDIRETLLAEVLRAKKPKLLIVGVTEQLPRDGHQAFGSLATAGEVLSSPLLINRKLPENIGRLPFRQLKLAAGTWAPEAFGFDAGFVPDRYPGTSFRLSPAEVHGDNLPEAYRRQWTPEEQRAALDAESARRRTEITRPLLPERLGDVEFGVSRTALRRIVASARANGVDVVFLFLPFYQGFEQPFDAVWLEGQAPIWTTDAFMRDSANFIDAAHMNARATPGVADWLAGRIAGRLGAPAS